MDCRAARLGDSGAVNLPFAPSYGHRYRWTSEGGQTTARRAVAIRHMAGKMGTTPSLSLQAGGFDCKLRQRT